MHCYALCADPNKNSSRLLYLKVSTRAATKAEAVFVSAELLQQASDSLKIRWLVSAETATQKLISITEEIFLLPFKDFSKVEAIVSFENSDSPTQN